LNYYIGNKIKLRKANPEDSNTLCRWYADGRIMIHVGFANGIKKDAYKLGLKLANQTSKSTLFIIMTKDNIPIGECNYNDLNVDRCSIGLKIGELSYQGKGYGEDALRTFIKYLFSTYTLKYIELDTLVKNVRAQNLYKKIGFKEIGIEEKCWTDPTGIKRSAIKMQLLREDFYN